MPEAKPHSNADAKPEHKAAVKPAPSLEELQEHALGIRERRDQLEGYL